MKKVFLGEPLITAKGMEPLHSYTIGYIMIINDNEPFKMGGPFFSLPPQFMKYIRRLPPLR